MLCSCDSCGGGPSREGTDLGLGAILPVGLESLTWFDVTWAAVTHKAMFLSLGLFFLGLFSLLQHFSHQLGHKHNKQEEALQKQN